MTNQDSLAPMWCYRNALYSTNEGGLYFAELYFVKVVSIDDFVGRNTTEYIKGFVNSDSLSLCVSS